MTSRLALIAALLYCSISVAEEIAPGNVALGKELYWYGKSVSGGWVQATSIGDVKTSGEQLPCVNCHRPSGFGSSEGGKYVPPISGPILFSPRQLDRNRIYMKLFEEAQPTGFASDIRKPRMRPGYNAETLAEALTKGIDPAGRKLDPQMPRYDLSKEDVANLAAYLHTLSTTFSPGVDAKDIHFATVVSDSLNPKDRSVFINTMTTFVEWMNRTTHGYQSRPGFSPYHMSELASAFRRWQLHVWELHGPPETWPEQLSHYYQSQPVFALVSGLVRGSWQPIGQFCNATSVPCIFPITELPDSAGQENTYSLHFSRGLELEGEALAQYFAYSRAKKINFSMLQSVDPYGSMPALAFKKALIKLLPNASIDESEIASDDEVTDKLRKLNSKYKKIDALILWPGEHLNAAMAALKKLQPKIKVIALPSAAIVGKEIAKLGKNLTPRLIFTFPYELPSVYNPHVFRVRQWMHSQHLEISDPNLQFQTYYALTITQFALDQILNDFYREYFIEKIEHLAENNLNIGPYPSLSLGPGQGFASKGAYIVQWKPLKKGNINPVSDWIVP